MVETTFLAGLGAIFFVILVVILRSGGGTEVEQKKQKKLPPKEKKPKVSKNPSKKVKSTPEPTEWTEVYTSAKDAQDMLEFLKGKDPTEIAKLNQPKKQQPPTKKKSSKKEAKSVVEK